MERVSDKENAESEGRRIHNDVSPVKPKVNLPNNAEANSPTKKKLGPDAVKRLQLIVITLFRSPAITISSPYYLSTSVEINGHLLREIERTKWHQGQDLQSARQGRRDRTSAG